MKKEEIALLYINVDMATGLEPVHLQKDASSGLLPGIRLLYPSSYTMLFNHRKQSPTIFTLSPRNDPQRFPFVQYLW